MKDYITIASIQAVRIGGSDEMLVGPASSSEIFPSRVLCGSSILLAKHFEEYFDGKKEWRGCVFLMEHTIPKRSGRIRKDEVENGRPVPGKLVLAPVVVELKNEKLMDKHLRTVTSAFEKNLIVVIRITEGNTNSFALADIEFIKEK